MTYKIKYLPLAVQDLNDIARYLSGFYPKTASCVLKELREKITKLGDTPKMCEVLGICRSIWNKFNFDCCERYRKPPAGYHHCGDSLPGVL